MKTTHRQSGVSLIEVLVVMVILLVGIMSVIRLFPPGFLINRQSEDATRAARLAKQEADRYTAAAANLPDDILPITWSGAGFAVDYTVTPDDSSTAPYQAPWSYYFSGPNRFRRVIGETVRVPEPIPTNYGYGSVYLINAGPFMDVSWDGRNRSVFVSGQPLRHLNEQQEYQDPPFVRSISQYAIDYDDAAIAFFPVGYNRQFLITVSYYDAGNQAQTLVDRVFDVPASMNGQPVWVALSTQIPELSGRSLVPDSDTVSRKFADLTDTAGNGTPVRAWSDDPYEFYVSSRPFGNPTGVIGNVGALVFNPRAHNYREITPAGPRPMTARIDYDVLDWRVIREDRPMPASPPYRVTLTLRNIKRMGDFETDQSKYIGLIADAGTPAAQRTDLLVTNVSTGAEVPRDNYTIDYKQGIVTFADAFGAANASGTFRFFYKAQGDWALVVQKASYAYRRHPGGGALVTNGEFYVGGGPSGGSPTRLYFPLMDAGKTVTIRDLYYSDGSATRHISNESYRINANQALFESFGQRRLTWLDLKEKHGDAVAWDYSNAGQPVVGVQGVSLKARVQWNNGSTITQTGGGNVERLRWRTVDMDTFLTRAPE